MVKKRTLLFIDSGFGYGGSAVFLYNFLCGLNKETFNPTLAFYFPPQGKDVENIKDLGIENWPPIWEKGPDFERRDCSISEKTFAKQRSFS
jgi:hypothetical protein